MTYASVLDIDCCESSIMIGRYRVENRKHAWQDRVVGCGQVQRFTYKVHMLQTPARLLRSSAHGLLTSRIRYYSQSLSSTQDSINHEEIAHFSRLSSQWWDEQGEFSFLHKMNPVRMQFIADKLLEVAYDEKPDAELERSQVLKGLDVLDVGCGGGLLSEVCVLALLTDTSANSQF